jgi:hypothetical protein
VAHIDKQFEVFDLGDAGMIPNAVVQLLPDKWFTH